MEQKKHKIKNEIFSSNNLKGLAKNIDTNIESEKEPQTPKIGINKSNMGTGIKWTLDEQKSPSLSLKILNKEYDSYTRAVFSTKIISPLKSFAYNSFRGLYKEYNEDKVSVVFQIKKPSPSKMKSWPKISYFAIFDGHGGETCSQFLKENFLNFLIENKNFPYDMKICLEETFEKAEEEFFKQKCGDTLQESDQSGSCALVAIIFDNKLYIANIGDSRAIMSLNGGAKVKQLSFDHKPNNLKEYERAIKNGSKVYIDDTDDLDRDESKLNFIKDKSEFDKYKKEEKEDKKEEIIFREYPSDLAVMRTIGDIKAKKKEYGGNPGTIINKPEIFVYDITSNDDFVVMGCDGIYDDLSNQEIVNAAWYIFKNESKNKNYDIHELSGDACDMIIKYAMEKKTSDNLSCVIIGLEGLEKFLKHKSNKDKVSSTMNNFKKDFKRSKTIK